MSRFSTWLEKELRNNPVPISCFTIAGAAFLAALVGVTISYVLAEAMAVLGMLAVSIFYFAMGLWYQWNGTTQTVVENLQVERMSTVEGGTFGVPSVKTGSAPGPARTEAGRADNDLVGTTGKVPALPVDLDEDWPAGELNA